jgi:hypothetical protein
MPGAAHVKAGHTVHADEAIQFFRRQPFATRNQRQVEEGAAMFFGEVGGALRIVGQAANSEYHRGVGVGGNTLGAHQMAGGCGFGQQVKRWQ